MQKPAPESRLVYPFEDSDDTLVTMPLAARRALDVLGRRLSLQGWLSLSMSERWRIVRAGAEEQVAPEVLPAIESATPPPDAMAPVAEPSPVAPPGELMGALTRPLSEDTWKGLRALDRYALMKYVSKPRKLARAYDAIVIVGAGAIAGSLSHVGRDGQAHMVDVGGKRETLRRAVASARVRTTRAVVEAVLSGAVTKGDVLATARIAGIMAAKKTGELIPLCHPVRVTRVVLDLEPDAPRKELRVRATVEALDRTGVEMEAMVAASVASLTIYDMIKSADRWATIDLGSARRQERWQERRRDEAGGERFA